MVMVQIPVKDLELVIDVHFMAIGANIPTSLSMKDMLNNGLAIYIYECTIKLNGIAQRLHLNNFFLIHIWGPTDMPFAMYTERELRMIHRWFRHPIKWATEGLLRRAACGKLAPDVHRVIAQIADKCTSCTTQAGATRSFKRTIGADGLGFNHTVQVDTIVFSGSPVLHMVEVDTQV